MKRLIILAILGGHSLVSGNSDELSTCNPGNRALFGKFLVRQWFEAKEELSIPSSNDISPVTLREIANILLVVNLFMPSTQVFYTAAGNAIPYATLWKCASEGITRNLTPMTCSQYARTGKCMLIQDTNSKESLKTLLQGMQWNCPNGDHVLVYYLFKT